MGKIDLHIHTTASDGRFSPEEIDPEAMCFEFKRTDTGKAVLVKLYPQFIPFPEDKDRQMGELFQPVLWDAAGAEDVRRFRQLWMEKVENMLRGAADNDRWLKLEVKGEER